MKMQMTMTMEDCCRCGQPIAPGEPAMRADRLGRHSRWTGRLVTGEGVPPEWTLPRRRQGAVPRRDRRSEGLPESSLDDATKRSGAYRQVVLPVSGPGLEGNVKREEESQ